MWSKTIVWLLAAAAAMQALGCSARMAPRDHARANTDRIFSPVQQAAPGAASLAPSQYDRANLDRAEALAGDLKYVEAVMILEPMLRRLQTPIESDPLAAEVGFWLAYCFEKQAQTSRAVELYRMVLARHADTPYARMSATRLASIAQTPPAPADDGQG
jgi:Tfp pilus assembly protein PilF